MDSISEASSLVKDVPVLTRGKNKLTRKYYDTLPAGAYLVSNTYYPATGSVFSEVIASSAYERKLQWKRIMVCAVGRLSILYESKELHDYLEAQYYAEIERADALKAAKKSKRIAKVAKKSINCVPSFDPLDKSFASVAADLLDQASMQREVKSKFETLSSVMGTSCTRAKLSKKFFMQLPAGDLLVSSVLDSQLNPLFVGLVAGASNADREAQWGEIVSTGANQLFCNVYSCACELKT